MVWKIYFHACLCCWTKAAVWTLVQNKKDKNGRNISFVQQKYYLFIDQRT